MKSIDSEKCKSNTPNKSCHKPIRVSPKGKKGKRPENVFMDDRGFPDQSDDFDVLLKNLKGGPVLRKHKHPCPDLSVIDPDYHDVFDEAKHGEYLNATLKVDHLTKDQAT